MSTRHLTTITAEEVRLLGAAVTALYIDEVRGQALNLRIVNGGRQWTIETPSSQLMIDIVDPACTANNEGDLALSERVQHFAQCFSEETVSLSIADDSTIVATAGSVTAAIDLVPQRQPVRERWQVRPSATAVVPIQQFWQLLLSARRTPCGVADSAYPTPVPWMQFGDGWVGLHIDWNDFVASRATYRIATLSQEGHTTTTFPLGPIETFISLLLLIEDIEHEILPDVTITVGTVRHDTGNRDVIVLAAGPWRLLVWLVHPLKARWATLVDKQFDLAGLDVIDTDGAEWIVAAEGCEVRVKLHHGHPDIARVSLILVQSVAESLELLRELSQLNASSSGIRYWLENDAVHAAADVYCTALNTLPAAIHQLIAAAEVYEPMLASLGANV